MNTDNNTPHQLFIVGTGIKFKSHLTFEAQECIKQADHVLYLVNEPAIVEWIESSNDSVQSLEYLYCASELRLSIYQNMTNTILETLDIVEKLCVVFYGHPGIFVDPGHAALIAAKDRGHCAQMLPGISAEDCLFADLGVDPASYGCLSVEATDFLLRNIQFDPRCHLILWQIGLIGDLYANRDMNKKKALTLLIEKLKRHYDVTHLVTIYEAAQYSILPPKIEQITLGDLCSSILSPIATLYIAPKYFGEWDKNILDSLGLEKSELESTPHRNSSTMNE